MRGFLLIILTGFCLWLAGFGCYVFWQFQATVEQPGVETDGILVLTGGTNRIHTGLMLMAAGQGGHLLISGVTPGLDKQTLIAAYDLPAVITQNLNNHCCITLGEQATSTVENAVEAAPWIRENQLKTIRLVTSVYHMPRAMLMLHEYAFDQPVEWVLHPVRPAQEGLTRLTHWRVMAAEYLKLTVALLIPLHPDR